MTMQSLLGSVFGAALLASSSSTVFAQAPEGYFTKEQAASGAALFSANCAQCHGAQLQGDEAPAPGSKIFICPINPNAAPRRRLRVKTVWSPWPKP